MQSLLAVALFLGLGLTTALIARHKGRSFWWWFLGGIVCWLPALCLVAVVPRGGEPYRFSALRALLLLAAALLGIFVTIGVISELSG